MRFVCGDIFQLYQNYDVIVHGCNCHSAMKSGIAPLMAREFGCDKFPFEKKPTFNKLGCIDYRTVNNITVVNAYTQNYPKYGEADYDAIKLCIKKIKVLCPGKVIMPAIGCGLAGGNPHIIFPLISHLDDVTVVILEKDRAKFEPIITYLKWTL